MDQLLHFSTSLIFHLGLINCISQAFEILFGDSSFDPSHVVVTRSQLVGQDTLLWSLAFLLAHLGFLLLNCSRSLVKVLDEGSRSQISVLLL